jgi:hypothetical protein
MSFFLVLPASAEHASFHTLQRSVVILPNSPMGWRGSVFYFNTQLGKRSPTVKATLNLSRSQPAHIFIADLTSLMLIMLSVTCFVWFSVVLDFS